jgi:glycosyltransferase involved in cell wall biosynthesis
VKVLHLANGNLFGGIESFLVTLAHLQHLGLGRLENFYLLSHTGRLRDEIESFNGPVHVVEGARLRNPWGIHRARAAARDVVRELAPDVVLAHGGWAYVVFGQGLLQQRTPVGLFQHGLAAGDVLQWLAARRPPRFVIANSEFTAETTPRAFPDVPIKVARYPVREPPHRVPRAVVRQQLKAGDDVIVIQTSRFEVWKGHQLLLESLAQLHEFPWQLWLAGGQSRQSEHHLRAQLEQFIASHGIAHRVRFLGERNDIGDLLAAADIYCQPNISREPFGIALVEAMSAGLPIVATDLGATADPVGLDVGRRVHPHPAALAAALEELIRDAEKRRRLGQAAQARFSSTFSINGAVAHLADVLESFKSQSEPETSRDAWA